MWVATWERQTIFWVGTGETWEDGDMRILKEYRVPPLHIYMWAKIQCGPGPRTETLARVLKIRMRKGRRKGRRGKK